MLDSVFQVKVTYLDPNYREPWITRAPSDSTGTASALRYRERNWIVTNAHVISNATFIQLRGGLDGDLYTVTKNKSLMGYDCDLALLSVSDEKESKLFWEKARPLVLKEGEMPTKGKVQAHGFPNGGTELSVTSGSIVRTELQTYLASRVDLLRSQIDAVIIPGNSGGPVVAEDKSDNKEVVGIAFETDSQLGRMIPLPILKHFLDDIIHHGHYTGFPEVSMCLQGMENPILRQKYALEEKNVGLLVNRIDVKSSAYGFLKEKDVLLSVSDIPIRNDGMINYPGIQDIRVSFRHAITQMFVGDKIKFGILREGKKLSIEIPLTRKLNETLLYPFEHEIEPAYVCRASVIVQPVTYNLFRTYMSNDNSYNGPSYFSHPAFNFSQFKQEDEQRWVKRFIISRVLEGSETTSYRGFCNDLIDSINGKKVRSVAEVIRAFDENTDTYHVIKTSDREEVVVPNRNPLPTDTLEEAKKKTQPEAALREKYCVPYLQSRRHTPGLAWSLFMKKLNRYQAIKEAKAEKAEKASEDVVKLSMECIESKEGPVVNISIYPTASSYSRLSLLGSAAGSSEKVKAPVSSLSSSPISTR